jgi:uncharacterized protein YfaQ (DUF2300 family)
MRRQEARAWLRSLSDRERNRYTAQADRLDPEMALAIIESPAELSGVLGADRKLLIDQALTDMLQQSSREPYLRARGPHSSDLV